MLAHSWLLNIWSFKYLKSLVGPSDSEEEGETKKPKVWGLNLDGSKIFQW